MAMTAANRKVLTLTRRRASRLAVEIGATIDVSTTGSVFTILIDAPDGKRWIDGVCLGLRIEGRPTRLDHRIDMWQDAINRMMCGIEDIPEDNQESLS